MSDKRSFQVPCVIEISCSIEALPHIAEDFSKGMIRSCWGTVSYKTNLRTDQITLADLKAAFDAAKRKRK